MCRISFDINFVIHTNGENFGCKYRRVKSRNSGITSQLTSGFKSVINPIVKTVVAIGLEIFSSRVGGYDIIKKDLCNNSLASMYIN